MGMGEKVFYAGLGLILILVVGTVVHSLRVERQRDLICWRNGYYERVFISEHCYCVDVAKGLIVPFENVEQQEWLDELEGTGKVETYLWKPSDWERIVEILR